MVQVPPSLIVYSILHTYTNRKVYICVYVCITMKTLSDELLNDESLLLKSSVKQFIKDIKELINGASDYKELCEEIDELAGERLI